MCSIRRDNFGQPNRFLDRQSICDRWPNLLRNDENRVLARSAQPLRVSVDGSLYGTNQRGVSGGHMLRWPIGKLGSPIAPGRAMSFHRKRIHRACGSAALLHTRVLRQCGVWR